MQEIYITSHKFRQIISLDLINQNLIQEVDWENSNGKTESNRQIDDDKYIFFFFEKLIILILKGLSSIYNVKHNFYIYLMKYSIWFIFV